MQDVPSNEPYAWLTNTSEISNYSFPLNDEFLIVSTRDQDRTELLFFDISNGIKPGDLMQHWCGYGIGMHLTKKWHSYCFKYCFKNEDLYSMINSEL
jgi:hypothetical protein